DKNNNNFDKAVNVMDENINSFDIKIDNFDKKIKSIFNAKICDIQHIGNGISANVYKIIIDKPPFVVAIKVAIDGELLKKECDCIQFIYDIVDIKLPKIFDINIENKNNYILMQYFDGVACSDAKVLNAPIKTRQKIAAEIAENIVKLQNIKGEKYGNLFEPQFENWNDYYKPFVLKMIDCAVELSKQGILQRSIVDTMNLAYKQYDNIFDEPISKPTLIHGDYWASNIIVDHEFHLIGVVDPFNAMWADSEYELFALNAVYGDKLPVLEEFQKLRKLSKKFDIKNEFYILFSEVYWVTIMKHDNNDYLSKIAKRLMLQLQKFNLL
ncbi:MAG: fructosamine kinase family protein, partial [Clostridia bacterium]